MAAETSGMESYAARLASFNIAHSAPKKRGSDAKGTKTLKWPHKYPAVDQLADAGFFFRPSVSNPDNVTCFLCENSLDDWEESDDPITEHLTHSPECGWAINVAIERQVSDEGYEMKNPLTEELLNARRMTFGSNWPHESKRGWVCKTQKMIEAGWYYCPTPEYEDFVKCSYCGLGLDGWEPKDNPYNEHRRRSPDCIFFSYSTSVKHKPGRARKSRTSKASRLSTQSNITTASEGVSAAELDIDDHVIATSPPAEVEKPTNTARGAKKGGRSKKTAVRPKTNITATRADDSTLASSFIEPEDDDFEVKVETLLFKNGRNKKRSSDEMNGENDDQSSENVLPEQVEAEYPPAKRRATRSRSSVMQIHSENEYFSLFAHEVEANMTDAETMPPPAVPASKKGAKGGRTRTSSRVRNASATSTASMASLRLAIPDDEDIDAALEAELDRPLTDDEAEQPQPEMQQPKTRRLTRTKPGSRKVTASIARVRRTTRASSINHKGMNSRDQDDSMQDVQESELAKASLGVLNISAKNRVAPVRREKAANGNLSRKVSPDLKVSESTGFNNGSNLIVAVPKLHAELAPTKPKGPRDRQPSHKLPVRNTQTSVLPGSRNFPIAVADTSSPVVFSHATEDDSGHETDASVASHAPKKRGGKKGVAAKKKTKGVKKAELASHNIENIMQPGIDAAKSGQKDDVSNTDVMGVMQNSQPELLQARSAEENSKPEIKSASTLISKESPPRGDPSSHTSENVEKINMRSRSQSVCLTEGVDDLQFTSNPANPVHEATPPQVVLPPGTPGPLPSMQTTPRPVLSPQSSDAENHPPSSRPSASRPPLLLKSPSHIQSTPVPSAACTPTGSATRRDMSTLQSTVPWKPVDLDRIFLGSPTDGKENDPFASEAVVVDSVTDGLSSAEEKLSMEEWIQFKARKLEEKLRNECERLVGRFEGEGVRALRTLEEISCVD